MPTFTTEQIIEYNKSVESVSLIIDMSNATNEGNLTVSGSTDSGWIPLDIFTTTGAEEYFVKGRTLKFTPTGGVAYDVPIRE